VWLINACVYRSPSEGRCCLDSCRIVSSSSNTSCTKEAFCKFEAYCKYPAFLNCLDIFVFKLFLISTFFLNYWIWIWQKLLKQLHVFYISDRVKLIFESCYLFFKVTIIIDFENIYPSIVVKSLYTDVCILASALFVQSLDSSQTWPFAMNEHKYALME